MVFQAIISFIEMEKMMVKAQILYANVDVELSQVSNDKLGEIQKLEEVVLKDNFENFKNDQLDEEHLPA